MVFTCRKIRGLVSDYLDDTLPVDQKRAFRAHLDRCGRCRRHVASLTRLVSEIRSMETLEPTPGFEVRLRHRLQEDIVEIPIPRPQAVPSWRLAALVVAASLVILVGGAVWWSNWMRSADSLPPVAESMPPIEAPATELLARGESVEEEAAEALAPSAGVTVGEAETVGSPRVAETPFRTGAPVRTVYLLDNLPSGVMAVDVSSAGEPRVAPERRPAGDSVFYLLPAVSTERGNVISTY
ncbi:hypothetical protein AMJ71_03280 [candidate division TA06 bacterium SM1_40]|uniref:Putative zinc-finger domain-containing protein n=1 Tax=candidate division TA06 bacterium SM1_40 TaxID=1703773 RepID=A0A0S8JNZ8_UNCT6|nr:MAG: hypothetical protein AMJ71_03280 [candidate division TA06 bacterium SM1_40]